MAKSRKYSRKQSATVPFMQGLVNSVADIARGITKRDYSDSNFIGPKQILFNKIL